MKSHGWVVGLVTVTLTLTPAQAQRPEHSPLEGVWLADFNFGPALRGDLIVTHAGEGWRATIGGVETQFQVAGDAIRFAFPSGGGFRGVLVSGGREIRGFWTQETGQTGRGAMAAPLTLVAAERDHWRGVVIPLDEHIRQFLRIFRDEAGALAGAFRSPELNFRGGASRFAASHDGDVVKFRAGEGEDGVHLDAMVLRDPERLRLHWPPIDKDIEFVRATAAQALGFVPRPPDAPPYLYQPPPELGDGWPTARARDVGFDEAALVGAVRRVIDADPTTARAPLMHSMLIAQGGRLVLEEYFYGYDRDTPHDIRSAGKTFSSVMLGALIRQGAQIGPDTPVYPLVASMGPFANPDPRKARITVAHLMTHTSGLACDDNDDESPGNEGTMQSQTDQADWWKYTLDLPMAHQPGTRYAYCSANANLVGAVLTTASATDIPELFARTIAEPLGFGRYYWNVMPNGQGYLGGGAHLRPRDLLKVGQVFLNGGQWLDQSIVSREWVARSTAPRVEVNPETTGLEGEAFSNVYFGGVDGYAWHLNRIEVGGHFYKTYEASGNGGQLLIVAPELDLTVVFTGGNFMQGGIWGRWRDQIVGGVIIPALAR